MYDPLIVDSFITVQKELASSVTVSSVPKAGLDEITVATQDSLAVLTGTSRLEQIAASSDEAATLRELLAALSSEVSLTRIGDALTKHVLRLIPFSCIVVFVYDAATDELEAGYTAGEAALPIKTMRIALGKHLSGWVAANRQTIVNSDPVLDLGEVARSSNPRLRSCLCTPVIADQMLVGVLTLYSSTSDAFSEEHQRVIEAVAQCSANSINRVRSRTNLTVASTSEKPGSKDAFETDSKIPRPPVSRIH
jgi:putative methionine-R-sulfoxide reductase with GAF domain